MIKMSHKRSTSYPSSPYKPPHSTTSQPVMETSTSDSSGYDTPIRPVHSQEQRPADYVTPTHATNEEANVEIIRNSQPTDPFVRRPEVSSDRGFTGEPIITYFTKRDELAAEEFSDIIKDPVVQYLKEIASESFSVILTHAGYDELSSVPVVLVVAYPWTDTDAQVLINIFDNLQTKFVTRLFCYDGSTHRYGALQGFDEYWEKPVPGCSLGPESGDTACSLGVYVKSKGDNVDTFALTVLHGFTNSEGYFPVSESGCDPAGSLDRCLVAQPAQLDKENRVATLQHTHELYKEGARSNEHKANEIKAELDSIPRLNALFGRVHCGERTVLDYDGEPMSSDIALIKLSTDRQGQNKIMFERIMKQWKWSPRDAESVYFTGREGIAFGDCIAKVGKTSGVTVGNIGFRYNAVLFDDSTETTSEFVVVSGAGERFARAGDSGGPVINTAGNLVGFILGGTNGNAKLLKGHENLGPVFATYISPSDFVFERVQALMGGEIELLVDLPVPLE